MNHVKPYCEASNTPKNKPEKTTCRMCWTALPALLQLCRGTLAKVLGVPIRWTGELDWTTGLNFDGIHRHFVQTY